MVRGLVGALAWASLGGMWWWQADDFWQPRRAVPAHERWLSADALEVEVHGAWRQVPLMPLADHLCRAPGSLFRRYCAPARP